MSSRSSRKNIGWYDSMKTNIGLTCGIRFIGRPQSVLLKQRLHRKKCDICSKFGGDPLTTKDLSSHSKAGAVAFKVSEGDNWQKLSDKHDDESKAYFKTTTVL